MATGASAYWRLSAVYFFFFALLGVQAPYWAPYLESLGFGPAAIGQLLAIFMLARVGRHCSGRGGWHVGYHCARVSGWPTG